MEATADVLVYAVSYVNCRGIPDGESRYDDGDVGALESIAGFLHTVTPRAAGRVRWPSSAREEMSDERARRSRWLGTHFSPVTASSG
jgi:hypothetical protein